MELKELLKGLEVLSLRADPGREITGVSYDSRTVLPGHVFVAIAGLETDGRAYRAEAMARGAACVVSECPLDDTPCVVVPSARRALAVISANWYGHPARELTVVGITGTNGKTSVSYLLRHILQRTADAKVGLVGTIQNVTGGEVHPARRTTPESGDLQALLRQMADAGCTHAVIEVSSHALALDRVYGIPFEVAVFTNLTQDHLDFHRTMEDYCRAKARLFGQCNRAVLNGDDSWCGILIQKSTCRRTYYGIDRPAQVRGEHLRLTCEGVSFEAVTEDERVPVRLAIPGRFSVYNALAAMTAGQELGVPLRDSARALESALAVPGRMEKLDVHGRDYAVLIDYAHTPDALENVLRTARTFARGRVVALFGCGGDRDRTKRAQMGAIAGQLADCAVITSDNPRTEDPAAIIEDILTGMPPGAVWDVVSDRAEAIRHALSHAMPGDVIVLCGKGHEEYQEVGHLRRHLDEREIVESFFREN